MGQSNGKAYNEMPFKNIIPIEDCTENIEVEKIVSYEITMFYVDEKIFFSILEMCLTR